MGRATAMASKASFHGLYICKERSMASIERCIQFSLHRSLIYSYLAVSVPSAKVSYDSHVLDVIRRAR